MDISQLTDWILENPIGFSGILIGVIGIILAVFFFIKGRKLKKPMYTMRSNNLIRDYTSEYEKIDISYANQKIENLTSTKVAFWNAGKDTLEGSDYASTEPLSISVKRDYQILDANIIQTSNSASQFNIVLDDNQDILIEFEYIDKDEGVVIQIIHTGKSSEDVELNGKVKGIGLSKNLSSPLREALLSPQSAQASRKEQRRILNYMMIFFVIIVIGISITEFVINQNTPSGVCGIIFFSLIICCSYYILHYKNVPKSLGIFDDD